MVTEWTGCTVVKNVLINIFVFSTQDTIVGQRRLQKLNFKRPTPPDVIIHRAVFYFSIKV